MYDDTLYAERVKQAGASGYLNKQAAPERLVSSIREIFSGGIAFEPGLTNRLTRRSCTAAGNPRSIGSLTDRELQVFELIGQGLTTRRIANRLKLSTHTIDTHREKIKAKLQLTSGVELMRHAVRWLLEQQWERCDDSGGGSRARVVIEDQLMQRAAATCPPGV
jgi:DNA-binding NarL/FixJ family response regulator